MPKLLGTTYQYQRSGAKRRLVEKEETFQYVPLIDNLKWLLQNKDIYNEVCCCDGHTHVNIQYSPCELCSCMFTQVFHRRDTPSHCLCDVCDGQLFKEHPLFSTDPNALQLLIYTDDVETANPLGSYRGTHKICKLVSYRCTCVHCLSLHLTRQVYCTTSLLILDHICDLHSSAFN